MSEDPDLETVAGLLYDESARSILTATSLEPMSAKELSEHCEVSLPTAYRWVERLEEAGLVAERTRPRPDGHHDTVYAATLQELSIRLDDGALDFELQRGDPEGEDAEDAIDRLATMWEDL